MFQLGREPSLPVACFVLTLLAAGPSSAAGSLVDLCGDTLAEDTRLRNVVETVPDDCTVSLAPGVTLRISTSEITIGDIASIGTLPAPEGSAIIIESSLFESGLLSFSAEKIVVRNSIFDPEFGGSSDVGFGGGDVTFQNSEINGTDGISFGSNDVKIMDSSVVGEDFLIITTSPGSAVRVSNSDLVGDFRFRSAGSFTLRNSTLRAGLNMEITAEDDVVISGNQIDAGNGLHMVIDVANLVLSRNDFVIAEVQDATIASAFDARITDNEFGIGSQTPEQAPPLSIEAMGGLLILKRNDFFQDVTYSGVTCRVKDNTVDPIHTVMNGGCPL